MSFKHSFLAIRRTRSNFGSALAVTTDLFTRQSTWRLNFSTLSHYFLTNCLGISVRKVNVMILLRGGEWSSKCRTWRENISSTLSTVTTALSEFKMVDSNFFLFSFFICYFLLFYFYLWGLRIGVNVISLSHHHISVMCHSHSHMSHGKA